MQYIQIGDDIDEANYDDKMLIMLLNIAHMIDLQFKFVHLSIITRNLQDCWVSINAHTFVVYAIIFIEKPDYYTTIIIYN
ncbi:hypothetical protein V1520DRAFT_337675 [Lipomyces starkeyi]